jgi:hypothetical protein
MENEWNAKQVADNVTTHVSPTCSSAVKLAGSNVNDDALR